MVCGGRWKGKKEGERWNRKKWRVGRGRDGMLLNCLGVTGRRSRRSMQREMEEWEWSGSGEEWEGR